ncbi:MAG: hypothetical protein KDC38_10335, partial [Planctomycetes bacterium]|nr:hypothetical protein [Planctomycetota bacterium]
MGVLFILSSCVPSTPPPPVIRPVDLEVDPLVQQVLEREANAASEKPNDPEQRGRLAMAYEGNEFYERARQAYANAETLDPHDPLWPYRRAVCRTVDEPEAGLADLRAVTERFPRFAPAWYHLARVLVEQG